MFTGVLLHQMEAVVPVKDAFHRVARFQRGGAEVDKNGLFFFRAEKSGTVTVRQVKAISKELDNSKALAPKVTPTKINY